MPELAADRWIATDTLEGSAAEMPEPDPESVAFLQYTSGSTATPKGVMVTHANLLHNERMIGAAFRQDAHSVVVGWLPLYHDMGLIGNVLQPLHAGGSCVLMAPVAFLQKPLRWLQAIDRYRGTTSGGPNFAYELCLRRIGDLEKAGLDLSSWRLAYNGAEPVRAETLSRFAEAFAPCGFRREAFYPCYGLAEATLFVSGGTAGTAPHVAPFEERPLVSCGHAWEGQRIAVVDPDAGGGAGARHGGRDLGFRAERGPRLLAQPGGHGARLRSASRHRRRTFFAHRRSRVSARRRAVRHRADQGPGHHPRGATTIRRTSS